MNFTIPFCHNSVTHIRQWMYRRQSWYSRKPVLYHEYPNNRLFHGGRGVVEVMFSKYHAQMLPGGTASISCLVSGGFFGNPETNCCIPSSQPGNWFLITFSTHEGIGTRTVLPTYPYQQMSVTPCDKCSWSMSRGKHRVSTYLLA